MLVAPLLMSPGSTDDMKSFMKPQPLGYRFNLRNWTLTPSRLEEVHASRLGMVSSLLALRVLGQNQVQHVIGGGFFS